MRKPKGNVITRQFTRWLYNKRRIRVEGPTRFQVNLCYDTDDSQVWYYNCCSGKSRTRSAVHSKGQLAIDYNSQAKMDHFHIFLSSFYTMIRLFSLCTSLRTMLNVSFILHHISFNILSCIAFTFALIILYNSIGSYPLRTSCSSFE